VIETVPFDIIFSFIIGVGLAWFFKDQLKKPEVGAFSPYFALGLIFECFFYLPLGIYLYYFYPAWSWMYFFDPSGLSPLNLAVLGILMVGCYVISYAIGFQLARLLIKSGRMGALKIIFGISVAVLFIFCLVTLNRLLFVGDYKSWRDGLAVVLFRHRLGLINTIMALCGFGALFWLLNKMRKFQSLA